MTTKPCPEYEPLFADRLTGSLDPAGEARLSAHLAGCAACRSEVEALEEAIELAALAPPAPEEMQALDGLADQTLRAYRFTERRRNLVRRTAVAALAAAAVIAMVLAPAFLGRVGHPPQATASVWREPNLDALWAKSALVSPSDPAAGDEVVADGVIFADYDGF